MPWIQHTSWLLLAIASLTKKHRLVMSSKRAPNPVKFWRALLWDRVSAVQNLRQIGYISIQPTVGAGKHMVASMVNNQHQIITHKLQTKHSKGVTVDHFLLLECLATSFSISKALLCAWQVKVACATVVTKFMQNSNPYCNTHTVLLTQDFTVNCGAVLYNQAAQVLSSLSNKYNY